MVVPPLLLRLPDLEELTAEDPAVGPLEGVRIEPTPTLLVFGVPDRPTDDGDVLGLGAGVGELGRRAGLLIAGDGLGVGVGAGRETEDRPGLD